MTGAMIAVGTFALLKVGTSYLNFRFKPLRPVLEGHPIVVVQDGKVVEENLKRERIAVEELAEAARIQQISSFDDVAWAIVETSGQISFIPKKSS